MVTISNDLVSLIQEEEREAIEEIHQSIGWNDYVSGKGFVARSNTNGKIIAYINLRLYSEMTHIPYFAVHKNYQGMGVGIQLFDQAVKISKENNRLSMELSCEVEKTGNFYRKCAKRLALPHEETFSGLYDNGDLASKFVFDLKKSL
ncbi:MAG: GNAT family N-acetyltransferase [Chlamydiota bacterium]